MIILQGKNNFISKGCSIRVVIRPVYCPKICQRVFFLYCSSTTEDLRDSWEIKTDTIFRSHIVRFTMNKALVDKTLDGRKVNMIVSRQSENRWIEKQKNLDTGKETMIVRDFFTDRMMVNLTAGAVRSFSTFVRQFTKD